MSSDLWTLCFVVGVWIFIGCVLIPLVLLLAAAYERYAGHRIEDAFLTPMERKAEARLIPADVVSQAIGEAERACFLAAKSDAELEAEWLLPCAPDPRWLA